MKNYIFKKGFLTGSLYYNELIKNLGLIRGLYNFKIRILKKDFDKLKTGKKILQTIDKSHPLIENDIYMKYLYKLMEIEPKFKEFTLNYLYNLNFDNFLIFEIKNYFILLFVEFEKYLYKCFKHALLVHPEIIQQRSLSLKDYMKYENINMIHEVIIDKYIYEISYKGFSKLFEKAEKPIGIKHGIDNYLIKRLSGFREIRHLHIHRDGIVDLNFIEKIEKLNLNLKDLELVKLKIGYKINISEEMLNEAEKLCIDIAHKFDQAFFKIYNNLEK